MDLMFLTQILVVLLAIVVGAKLGGAGLGMAGGAGLFVLTFVLGLKPAMPPVDVMLIITAVVTAAATLQAGGGLDLLVNLAEKLLRSHPQHITFLAPLVTYLSTIFCGTGYVSLCLYPVIAEVATEAGIRPERPMSIALVANQQAITASPLSAAVAAMLVVMAPFGITLGTILSVTVPATIVGSIAGALSVYHRGKELADDPVFKEKVAKGELEAISPKGFKERHVSKEAKRSLYIFCFFIAAIILFGSMRSIAPSWDIDGKHVILSIPETLEILMLLSSCIMVLCCKINPADVIKNSVFQSGMMGSVSVFGVAWMMDTFFTAHKQWFVDVLSGVVSQYPFLFAGVLFFFSAIFFSHAATVRAIMPLGVTLGIAPNNLVAMLTASSGYFFIPTGGLTIACVAFDRTGTTKIGNYILNHSFMLPGLVTLVTSLCMAFVMIHIVF
jgi:anaerobic C4-dicarboxylate transporter DcuA